MNGKNFEPLINNEKFQVFLFTSPCSLPVSFIWHSWFVVNKKGTINRWEILHMKNWRPPSWDYLHMNFLRPFQGVGLIPFLNRYSWRAKLLGILEGGEDSTAKHMVEFIENSKNLYPFRNKYSFPGPNSNTYTQWTLNKFPEFPVTLPNTCLGKNYLSDTSDVWKPFKNINF